MGGFGEASQIREQGLFQANLSIRTWEMAYNPQCRTDSSTACMETLGPCMFLSSCSGLTGSGVLRFEIASQARREKILLNMLIESADYARNSSSAGGTRSCRSMEEERLVVRSPLAIQHGPILLGHGCINTGSRVSP